MLEESNNNDISDVLLNQNPWWVARMVPPEYAKLKQRVLAQVLWKQLARPALRRFQIILGPRRVGKTTVMYQTVKNLLNQYPDMNPTRCVWMRLDHPRLMQTSLGSLVELAMSISRCSVDDPLFLFMDEISYADQWDHWLKTFYDENWPVQIMATSSSSAAIRDRSVETGTGRWEEHYLAPYMLTEYLELLGGVSFPEAGQTLRETIQTISEWSGDRTALSEARKRFLLIGGYPELLTTSQSKDEVDSVLLSQNTLRSDAIHNAVYKDLPQVYTINEPAKLERLLYTLAGQITGTISPTKIAGDIELSSGTVERYITYLEHAFIVFQLLNYSTNEGTIQRRGRKMYFVDGALRNAALLRGLAPLKDPAEMGILLENSAAAHLHALSQLTSIRTFYWRDKKNEVDLIYDDPNGPLAFEITASSQHKTNSLHELQERYPTFDDGAYLITPDAIPTHPSQNTQRIGRLPFDLFLLAVGIHAENALQQRIRVQTE